MTIPWYQLLQLGTALTWNHFVKFLTSPGIIQSGIRGLFHPEMGCTKASVRSPRGASGAQKLPRWATRGTPGAQKIPRGATWGTPGCAKKSQLLKDFKFNLYIFPMVIFLYLSWMKPTYVIGFNILKKNLL